MLPSRPDRRAVPACRQASWAALGCLLAGTAAAQSIAPSSALATGPGRSWQVQPLATVSQTFSDNFQLSALNPASDAITRLTAGLALSSNAGPLRGYLDYSLTGLLYARHSELNTLQNNLSSAFTADLVPGRARLDVTGSVSRSAISAFAAQPGQTTGVQANSTELRRLRVAPSAVGPLAQDLRYSAKLVLEATDARDAIVGDSTTGSLAVHTEPSNRAVVGWSLDGSLLRSDFKAGRATSDDRLFGSLRWRIDSLDTELTGSGGIEYSDMTSAARQRFTNWGLGATWTPSPRTTATAQYEDRFYGPSRRFSLDHRTALTTWHLAKGRSLSTSGGQGELGGRGTAFDLLFAQFATAVPDPGKRSDLVNAYLSALGIAPGAEPGFLRSTVLVQDFEEASMAWRGPRDTAVLSWTRSRSTRLGAQPGVADDLSVSDAVALQGLSLDLSHRLTPESSVGLVLSRQRGNGLAANQNNLQRKLGLRYALRPTANSSVNLGFSRTLADSFPAPYDETALVVTLGYRF